MNYQIKYKLNIRSTISKNNNYFNEFEMTGILQIDFEHIYNIDDFIELLKDMTEFSKYSFNNIKHSDLGKIEIIMYNLPNKEFTIDNEEYNFNNFIELSKHIKWDLYYQYYVLI